MKRIKGAWSTPTMNKKPHTSTPAGAMSEGSIPQAQKPETRPHRQRGVQERKGANTHEEREWSTALALNGP